MVFAALSVNAKQPVDLPATGIVFFMKHKILFSLFDLTGNASRPYKEAGWNVVQIDIKKGKDILTWDYKGDTEFYLSLGNEIDKVGIIAAVPCTAYALSGNRHKNTPERKILFEQSQKLVAKTKEIIDYFNDLGVLDFWVIENPMSDIHTHNKWMGKVRQKFNPCDFALYDPNPEDSRYNKQTWLWGNYRLLESKRLEPLQKDNPGWRKLGGKSEKTKDLRSVTPLGFAYAFFEHNN